MRINQLRFLVALEKYGSYSRAAQELYVSQPSISIAIKELEEELGYQLLKRSSKGVSFTAEGSLVLAKVAIIVG